MADYSNLSLAELFKLLAAENDVYYATKDRIRAINLTIGKKTREEELRRQIAVASGELAEMEPKPAALVIEPTPIASDLRVSDIGGKGKPPAWLLKLLGLGE